MIDAFVTHFSMVRRFSFQIRLILLTKWFVWSFFEKLKQCSVWCLIGKKRFDSDLLFLWCNLICVCLILGSDCSINKVDSTPGISDFFWLHVYGFAILFATIIVLTILQFSIFIYQRGWKNVTKVCYMDWSFRFISTKITQTNIFEFYFVSLVFVDWFDSLILITFLKWRQQSVCMDCCVWLE